MRYAIKEVIPRWMLSAGLSPEARLHDVRKSMVYQLAQALMDNFGNKPLQRDRYTGEQFLMFDIRVEEETETQHIAAMAERNGYIKGRESAKADMPWGFDEVYE